MASRIHGDVYVRFRGRYAETCRRKAVRRCIPSLQTNLQEARPELWQKLEKEYSLPKIENGEYFSFAPVDALIKDNLWICPIKPQHQDNAYYSISKNEIVVPEKEQFKSGEAFYGTLFHEMTHSTGAEGVLDRIKPTTFGSAEYAREELVAELGSALVAQRYGMTKHIKEDSCAYLKGWLDELKESPQFIKTTLLDVKRAASLITQKVDKIALELKHNIDEAQTAAPKEKVYYSSVAYLQLTDDTMRLDAFKDKGDYEGLLTLAKEYYDGNGINEEYTYSSPIQNRGDNLLIEDKDFAVVYNGSVGGTFDPFTIGHSSVVTRALTFMDEVIIGIGINENKNTYFPIEKRVEIIQKFYRNEPRIKVYSYDCLTIDFARQVDAQFIVRGIRTVKDFEYEETIADINRKLAGIETILLFTEPELTCISSTTVRELLQFGKDISQFIPEGMDI